MEQTITCNIYGYSLSLYAGKTSNSLTLPNTGNFRIVATDLVTTH